MTRCAMLCRLAVAAALCLAAAAADAQCAGDCNGDNTVAVNELVLAVNIALGSGSLAACPGVDASGDGVVAVNELVGAVTSALNGCPVVRTPSPTPTDTVPPTATPTATETAPATATATPSPTATLIPIGEEATLAWLQSGAYREWARDATTHASAGPHFGTVRTYLNDTLFASLAAGAATHPVGAAAVNELYSGEVVRGWAVSVKRQADSAGGAGWYWFQTFGGSRPQQGVGLTACTTCHAVGRDFVRTRLPLVGAD